MSKSVRLTNDTYLDTSSIVHNKQKLNEILDVKILWENPDKSSAFEQQTITLNSTDYDFYEMYFLRGINFSPILMLVKSIKGYGFQVNDTDNEKLDIRTRTIALTSSNTLYISHGRKLTTSGYTENDNLLIPMFVIGYKTNTFK